MNYQLLLAATLVTAACVLSGELFRRGVLADDREIRQRHRRGNNSWKLFWLMVALAAVGYFLSEVKL